MPEGMLKLGTENGGGGAAIGAGIGAARMVPARPRRMIDFILARF